MITNIKLTEDEQLQLMQLGFEVDSDYRMEFLHHDLQGTISEVMKTNDGEFHYAEIDAYGEYACQRAYTDFETMWTAEFDEVVKWDMAGEIED